MTRILQVMAGADVGGAEAFFTRLVPALARAGITQEAVLRHHAARQAVLDQAGVKTHGSRFGGLLDRATPRKIQSVADRFGPDLTLCWMNRAARMAPKGPHVTAARLGGYYDLKYYRKCDHLVGNTRGICDYLVRAGWPKERTWYLPNFVDNKRLPAVARATFDTPDDAFVILGLGRLHRNKAFDAGLEALAQIPDAYYWIAGEGPERAALQAQADRLGVADRVRFLGWRDDVPALFAASNLFLCSSRHEPLGNMVIEAWAQGCPVVAAASQGPSQLIADQRTGLLVPVDDPDQMAAAVKRILDAPDLGLDLARRAEEAYQAEFTEARVVEQYMEFFGKVVG